MLVELKNGETLNGHLVTCDTWMNLTLKEVVQTSPVRIHLSLSVCDKGIPCDAFRSLTRRIVSHLHGDYLLMKWRMQEGDKFFRLPEVYVKGNNVRRPTVAKSAIY